MITYSGPIVVDSQLTFDAVNFNFQFTATVSISYQASIISPAAFGTLSVTGAALSSAPVASLGVGSAGAVSPSPFTAGVELPPQASPVVNLDINLAPLVQNANYWIAQDILTLNITTVTATEISGTDQSVISDNINNPMTLNGSFTLVRTSLPAHADFTGAGTSDILWQAGGRGRWMRRC